MLTSAQLRKIMPQCRDPDGWLPHLEATFERFEINSPQRKAAFLAQVGHESTQLNRTVENLNFSAAGLRSTWPKRFPDDQFAARYHRQPEKIANYVYGGRNGNGDEASGDGWRFRGRGLIQLTFRSNYVDAGRALKVDLVANPDALLDRATAAAAAGWFWQSRGLNALADHAPHANDDEDFRTGTRIINGGLKGLAERMDLWRRARAAFGI